MRKKQKSALGTTVLNYCRQDLPKDAKAVGKSLRSRNVFTNKRGK